MRIGVIDLFCGIGGLSLGFKKEGFDILAGVDSDASCRFAFEKNIGADFIDLDVGKLTGTKVGGIFDETHTDYRVLIGCAPCTPFSLYAGRYRRDETSDSRWGLLRQFARIVKQTRPDVISMENVPQLTKHDVFADFVSDLESLGYHVSFQRVRCEQYGIPQKRSRLVLIASRFGKVALPPPTHRGREITVRSTIGDLPRIEAGQPCDKDRLHVSRGLSPVNLKRLRATREGGSWKDWDASLQLACHKKENGKSFRSVYGRMNWDAPSPVITTQCLGIGNGRFGHPEQDRAISIREAALLQTFPRGFQFVAPKDPVVGLWLARQIGNAVPVKLGRLIAKTIKGHLADVSAGRGGA